MGTTQRYGFTYPDRGEPMRLGRQHFQTHADTLEAGLGTVEDKADAAVTTANTARGESIATADRMTAVEQDMIAALEAVGTGGEGGLTDAGVGALVGLDSSATATALRAWAAARYAPLDAAGIEPLLPANAAALRPFHAALAARHATPCDLVIVGDSITEGQGAGAADRGYLPRLRDALRTAFPVPGVTGGRGYVPGYWASGATDGFTYTASPSKGTNYGLGRRNVGLASTGQTLSLTMTCSSFDVVFTAGPATGTIAVSVDGAPAVHINTNQGTVQFGKRQRFTPAAAGSHSVVISYLSGGTSYVEGVMIYHGDEDQGLRIWNAGHALYKVADMSGGSWSGSLTPTGASLLALNFGTNDYRMNTALGAFTSGYQGLLDLCRPKLPDAALLLIIPPQVPGTFAVPWSSYVSAMYDLADANGAAVFDLNKRLAPNTTSDPLGLIGADGIHPTAAGHSYMADALASFLAPR